MQVKNFWSGLIAYALLLTLNSPIQAQSPSDALRFGQVGLVGTARNIAVGGVMGSLGGDFSAANSNPAGIARYKSTEFGISPNVAFGKTNGSYLGNNSTDNYSTFNISSASVVFAKQEQRPGFRGFSAGIGINRQDQYDEKVFLTGINSTSSLLDQHEWLAEGIDRENVLGVYPFDAGLSYEAGLLYTDSLNTSNYSSVFGGASPDQDVIIERSGGKYQVDLAVAGNYEDKVYFGGSIGLPVINYKEDITIGESNNGDAAIDTFNFFRITDKVTSNGVGVNFTVGILARPHKLVRIGAAFQTPTLLRMEDRFLTQLFSDFIRYAYEIESPDGAFTYSLVLPWKVTANAGVILGEYGFFGLEYEVHDPGQSRFNFKSDDADILDEEESRNQQIADSYTWQHVIKSGVEFRIKPIRLRAGFQYKTSPLVEDGSGQKVFTGGLGYRGKNFFVDVAYSYHQYSSIFMPYGAGPVTSGEALLDHNRSQVVFTVGVKL